MKSKFFLYICIVIIAVITNKEIRGNTINRLDLAATKSGLFNFMEAEIWKDIPGYEGIYQVSDLGRLKSIRRGVQKDIKACLDSGYMRVCLSKDGFQKSIKIHRIVAMAFLNHKPDGTHKVVIDHINNIKTDNRLCNLQLTTARHNVSKDRKDGSSTYIGVSWGKRDSKWRACISINGKFKQLGTFNSEIEASKAYQLALDHLNCGHNVEEIFPTRVPTSKYNGVHWHKRLLRWQVSIYVNKKNKHIGYFTCETEAHQAYQNKLNEIKSCA